MNLSPSILFHFTNKNALFKILASNFKISYSLEKIQSKGLSISLGLPMISFCDLRLSEVSDHMDKYGRYGIGLSKSWANRMGLNPVMYVNRHSHFTKNYLKSLESTLNEIRSTSSKKVTRAHLLKLNLFDSFRYLKNYEDDLKRPERETIENYRFADEREWRYVPPMLSLNHEPFLSSKEYMDIKIRNQANSEISNKRLRFKPWNIRYLILEKDSEINELIDHLTHVKSQFSGQALEKLKSRIISSERILHDI